MAGVVASLLLVGCGGSSASSGVAGVTVSPASSLADQPVDFRVRGLTAGERITLRVSSTDAKGVRWSSSEQFVAQKNGRVNVDDARARSGAYTGVWGMGPLSAMRPETRSAAGAYFWSPQTPGRFRVTVVAHHSEVAETTFSRRFGRVALTTRSQTLRNNGFVARFVSPQGASHHAAVLLLGGSEGGIPSPLISAALAAQGYPVLALAYFKAPGLPSTLSRIPLEYFARALRWMRRQPEVNPRRIAVLGSSRGSEPAQLLGVHYPTLVHAVIVIPDQRIHGPVLLACGGMDKVWTSCPYADAIQHHLLAADFPYRHVLYRYPNAGHAIAELDPYEPIIAAAYAPAGGDFAANQRAIAHNWPRLLAFLARFSHS